MSKEYYTVLARMIAAVGHDASLLRRMVYQLARAELRRELYRRRIGPSGLAWTEKKQQISALEEAIHQIESDIEDGTLHLTFSSEHPSTQTTIEKPTGTGLLIPENRFEPVVPDYEDEILPPSLHESPYTDVRDRPVRVIFPANSGFSVSPRAKLIRAAFWSTIQLMLAAMLGVALYVALAGHQDMLNSIKGLASHDSDKMRQVVKAHSSQGDVALAARPTTPVGGKGQPIASNGPRPQTPDIPIPGAYGVYAVNHGKLIDLQPLPIRVPDQRVAISGIISTPSRTVLPDGQLEFIAYRRDLVNDAPDRAMVRVVARVMRALTFDAGGKPKIIDVEASWAVRGKGFEMRIAPSNGNPEIVVVRPEKPEFSFPPGRYVLVLKNVAYDFTVDGQITDPTQCLERTDALNAPVYSECRSP